MIQTNRKTFSVLMAAKNAENTIELAVRSTLLALGSRDELLVYLDGCQDGTELVLRRVKDSRLKVYESPVTVGRSDARNQLSLRAKGDFLAILDADDVSLPWRFWVSRQMLKKSDAIFGSAIFFGALPHRLPLALSYPIRLRPELARLVLTYRNPFIHSSAAFKRNIVTPGDLYRDIVAEEYQLWMRLALQNSRLYRTPIPLIAYRFHAKQISKGPGFFENGEACPQLNATRESLTSQQSKLWQEDLKRQGYAQALPPLQVLARDKSWGIRIEETMLASILKALTRLRRQP